MKTLSGRYKIGKKRFRVLGRTEKKVIFAKIKIESKSYETIIDDSRCLRGDDMGDELMW